MEPFHYLKFGYALIERLQRTPPECLVDVGQADCRSIISRAYYAAFHVARALLASWGFGMTKTGLCHEVVQKALNNSSDSDLQSVAGFMNTLYSERRVADY